MGKAKIGKDGAHLWGCECRECMKTNAVCPQCGTHYWTDPDFPEMEECHHCMWTPGKSV